MDDNVLREFMLSVTRLAANLTETAESIRSEAATDWQRGRAQGYSIAADDIGKLIQRFHPILEHDEKARYAQELKMSQLQNLVAQYIHAGNVTAVGQCHDALPHYCARCGVTFECLTPADDAAVAALQTRATLLETALAALVRKTEECDNPRDEGVSDTDDVMVQARRALGIGVGS